MNNDQWICSCGAESTGKFCLNCGLPRSRAEAEKNRAKENAASGTTAEERRDRVPTLAEVKTAKEEHGPLIACRWSQWSNGMMMGSHEGRAVSVSRQEDGSVQLRIDENHGAQGGMTTIYRAEPELLEQLDAVCKRENLAAWSELREAVNPMHMIFDYSAGANLTLDFDDSAISRIRRASRSINAAAARQQGGGEVLSEMIALMESAAKPSALIATEQKNPTPGGMGVFGMGMMDRKEREQKQEELNHAPDAAPLQTTPDGKWICPACGYANPGKFCANCGAAKPVSY